MDLRARAIITAVDRFSAPVGRMASALNAFSSRAAAVNSALASRVGAAGAAAGRMSAALRGPLTIGLGATIYASQEFERRLLGIQMASMAAADDLGRLRQVNDLQKLRADADELKESVLDLSRALGFSPTGLIRAGEAAAKLGVPLANAEAIMRNAAIWNMAESDYAPSAAAEFLGKTAMLFRAPQEAAAFNAWIAATADKIATVAAATPTDLGTFSEGLRQFGSAFAVSGGTIDEAAALLGTATAMGQHDIETGTALKMGLVRLINPTLGHVSALNNAGIDRSKYIDLTGADPRRAINQLVQLFPGYVDKKLKRSLFEQLEAAAKEGRGADPEFIGQIAGRLNRATGSKESIDDTYLKVVNAITTSGGRVDYYGYLRDVADMKAQGKFSDAAFIEAFTKFHYSRMMSILSRPDLMDKYLGLSQSASGEGQDTRAALYAGSEAGKWDATIASLQRSLIRLRESEGIRRLIETVGKLADRVASMPPGAVEVIGGVAAALVALAGAGLVLGGVAAGLTALSTAIGVAGAALGAIGLLGGGGAMLTAAGVGAAGYLGYEAWKKWDGEKGIAENFLAMVAGDSGRNPASGAAAGVLAGAGAAASPSADVGARDFSGMLRDYLPSLDVTGKVDAQVHGNVEGKVHVDVDVKVDGGRVVDTRSSGGALHGELKTGKAMPDTSGP